MSACSFLLSGLGDAYLVIDFKSWYANGWACVWSVIFSIAAFGVVVFESAMFAIL
jgi:hypothetical protein